jgi:hypothetical protein
MTLFEERDWKEYLNEEAKKVLVELLQRAKNHKHAYEQADDVKIAQLWAAIVELKKDIDKLNALLGKIEEPFKAIVSIGEAEKRKAIERLVSEIIRPVDAETQEATKKLVESLMKF